MKRVFCANSWELEGERRAFYDIVGHVNELQAMSRGMLYVPVSLTNFRDKRPLQYVVDENLRDSHYYLLALTGDWGPPERNFERDFRLALQYLQDPAMPMTGVALLLRREGSSPPPLASELTAAGISWLEFGDLKDFCERTQSLLSGWLAAEPDDQTGQISST